eukprot:gene4972-6929_t
MSLGDTDHLSIRRYSASATHDYFISEDFRIRTTAFGYTTSRDWSREDFDNSPNPDRDYTRIVGNPDVDGGAIYFRGTTGNRNRTFEVAGIEPRFSYNFSLGGVANEMDFGARFLYERAFEQRINGVVSSPISGELRDDEIRTGYATSGYIQNKTYITNRFTVTPGLRIENFIYDRDILRLNHENVGGSTRDELTEFIPGVGLNFIIQPNSSIYAGVHRGFGPPRVKDAISADGISEELDAEFSWNYEIGTRNVLNEFIATELTFFYLDFSNQVIPVAEAAGGAGAPGTASLING